MKVLDGNMKSLYFLLVCTLFTFSMEKTFDIVIVETVKKCQDEYGPSPVTNNNEFSYPYVVIVVRIDPPPDTVEGKFVACGSIINRRWVLTKATVLEPGTEWAVVGINMQEVPDNLQNVPTYPVEKVVKHPDYNLNRKIHINNVALLKLKSVDETVAEALAYWRRRPLQEEIIRHMENIYWVYDKTRKSFIKYKMSWCPSVPPSNCRNRKQYIICLSTTMANGGLRTNFDTNFPCTENTLNGGGPIAMENEFNGMYIGVENEGTRNVKACAIPSWKTIEHVGIRIMSSSDVNATQSTMASKIMDWINRTIAGEEPQLTSITTLDNASNGTSKSTTVNAFFAGGGDYYDDDDLGNLSKSTARYMSTILTGNSSNVTSTTQSTYHKGFCELNKNDNLRKQKTLLLLSILTVFIL